MSSTPANAYLERLQRNLFAATGEDPERLQEIGDKTMATVLGGATKVGFPDAEAIPKILQEEFARGLAMRPSRYEDPLTHMLMVRLADDLEKTAGTLGYELPPRPVFGTLPLGQLNASAIAVPDSSEHLIVFQKGLFGFMNLLAKAVAASLPWVDEPEGGGVSFSTDVDKIREHLKSDSEPAARLADFVASYVVEGDPHRSQQYFLGGPAMRLAEILRYGGELFVLAHEYGHIVSGHLESDHRTEQVADETLTIVSEPWVKEHQADYIGMILAVSTMHHEKDLDIAMAFGAVDLVFSAMALVDAALGVVAVNDPEATARSDTHPPAQLRQAMLREMLDRALDDEAQVAAARLFAETLDEIMQVLWDSIAPYLSELHARGVRPSPIWGIAPA
ncbi:hypothetical protein OJ997_28680 [Solirubrobacter phytolaccae]|uniref:Uncharacterized protein n=1 Tax=Solirubrobacter phytolaccae TaxID=1404360 RepID=A0A9X3NCU2_9ACTN|nr:hypothetical protein [Solirubrobacter phytolaccae]MDA0184315.1 hypothetical protein [Solirubrobacter phytolaccae]